MTNISDIPALEWELSRLRREQHDLDSAIEALCDDEDMNDDSLQITRLKRRKSTLKDRIMALEKTLFPDIIA